MSGVRWRRAERLRALLETVQSPVKRRVIEEEIEAQESEAFLLFFEYADKADEELRRLLTERPVAIE